MNEKPFEPSPDESLISKFRRFISKEPSAADAFKKFEADDELSARLTGQMAFKKTHIESCNLKLDIASRYVKAMAGTDMAASVCRNFTNKSESDFDAVVDLHVRADFVARHAKDILKILHRDLVELPADDLNMFLSENAADLKRLGIS